MASFKANGDPLEGTITPPNYGAVVPSNNAAFQSLDWSYGDQYGDTQQDHTPPTAPTLSSPSHTSTTVALSWTAGTDDVEVAGYRAYKGGVQIGSDIAAGTTTLSVTGLTTATAYTFTVLAFDENGNVSPLSNSLSVTTS